MRPGAINFSRPRLSANFNDGSGINLSSSSSLNISAGYAGDITIKAKSKLEAKKGESSVISLENDLEQGLHTHAGEVPNGANPLTYDFKNSDNRYINLLIKILTIILDIQMNRL